LSARRSTWALGDCDIVADKRSFLGPTSQVIDGVTWRPAQHPAIGHNALLALDALSVDPDPHRHPLVWILVPTAPLPAQMALSPANPPPLRRTRSRPITRWSFPAGRSTFRCCLSLLDGVVPRRRMPPPRLLQNTSRSMSIWETSGAYRACTRK
jgi:hypothetical protein